MLFESRLDDGRWVGHAADHTPVAVEAKTHANLENAIGRVTVARVDPAQPDRVVGRLVGLVPPPAGGFDAR